MNEPDHAPDEVRRRRLLYRATHRGTHEADLLVGGFVGPRIGAMSAEELGALEMLLELPDTVLADWITGRRELPSPPPDPLPQGEGELSERLDSPPPLAGGGRGEGLPAVLVLLAQMKAAAGA